MVVDAAKQFASDERVFPCCILPSNPSTSGMFFAREKAEIADEYETTSGQTLAERMRAMRATASSPSAARAHASSARLKLTCIRS